MLVVYPQFSVRKHLKNWADANGLVITKAERRLVFAGPFLWKRSGIVFRIAARTRSGDTLTGWIRFGLDLFRRKAWSETVIWDKPRQNA